MRFLQLASFPVQSLYGFGSPMPTGLHHAESGATWLLVPATTRSRLNAPQP
jgi:hypothetical protein